MTTLEKINNSLKVRRRIAFTFLGLLILVPSLVLGANKTAENAARDRLSGAYIDVQLDRPYNTAPAAFPDGKDAIFATVEVFSSAGTFLKNEPLVIEKPDEINIEGPTTTSDGGSFRWRITSTKPMRAQVIVKLANYPRVRRTFSLNFRPIIRIADRTDRQAFFYDLPMVFTAQIDPSFVEGVKKAELLYSYERNYRRFLSIDSYRTSSKYPLHCSSDGWCSATVSGTDTYIRRVEDGNFRYTFRITDVSGRIFQITRTGRLIIP